MCLQGFVEMFKTKKPSEVKYIPLQNICCEPINYQLTNCLYYNKNLKIDKIDTVPYIELQKDRFILGDNENIKYEHISHVTIYSLSCVCIYVFGKINTNTNAFYFEDFPGAIVIKFNKNKSNDFVNNLMKYIISYKKYNSFDKTATTFKAFKHKRINFR